MFHHKCEQNCLLIVLAVYLFKSWGASIVRGGFTPSFSNFFYKKYPKLCKIVQIVIKAPHLTQSCPMVYQSTLEGEPPGNCRVMASLMAFSTPLF